MLIYWLKSKWWRFKQWMKDRWRIYQNWKKKREYKKNNQPPDDIYPMW